MWLRITNAFRLSEDPGASFALASSLDAAMAMADNLGFGGLAHVTKARRIIQAVSAALLKIPANARLKLANAQFGTHRCSGSPSEFPLCCFTTRTKEHDTDERVSRSSTERVVPEVNTLLEFDPEDATVAEPVQHELAFAPATAALESEAPLAVAKFDDRRTAYPFICSRIVRRAYLIFADNSSVVR